MTLDPAAIDQAITIVNRRGNRAIATILGVKERDCDTQLSRAASDKLRKTVLDQINELVDLAVDCIRSIPPDGMANEMYMTKVNEIHQGVELMVASLKDGDGGTV